MTRVAYGIIVAAGIISLASCAPPAKDPVLSTSKPEWQVNNQSSAYSAYDPWVDRQIAITGVATDTQFGAVLKAQGGTIYIAGMKAWPAEIVGKSFTVTGKLVRKKLVPDPGVNDAGVYVDGLPGTQLVFETSDIQLPPTLK
jgi:hypothetical protein